MKAIAAVILFVIVTLLLRSTALTALAARGVVIDVLAFATVVWAMRHVESGGTTFGFVLGIAADLDAAHWMGRHALLLALLGYTVGRLSHTLVRDSARTQCVLLFFATIVHQTWAAAFEFGGVQAWPHLLQRVILAGVATAPLGTLLLGILRRVSGQSLFSHAALSARTAT